MPKKLAGQIISLILFMLLSINILIFFFFFILTDFHEELENRINNGTYIDQMADAINIIENSQFRDDFSLSSFRVKFYVINASLFDHEELTTYDHILSQNLKAKIGNKYPNAAMQQLYAPQSRISAALKHFIGYLSRINTDEKKTYSPSVILQSQVQLTNGQWVVMLVLDVYPFPEWIAETLKPLLLFSIIFILFSIELTCVLDVPVQMTKYLQIADSILCRSNDMISSPLASFMISMMFFSRILVFAIFLAIYIFRFAVQKYIFISINMIKYF